MVTYFWFTPTRTGAFDALCEQLCGVAHFAMRGRVVVDEQDKFDDLARAATDVSRRRRRKSPAMPAAGQALYATCSTCHGAQAEGNRELNAPKLSGQARLVSRAPAADFSKGVRGAHENDTYGKQMVPVRIDARGRRRDSQRRRLHRLAARSTRPPATVLGNPDEGKDAVRDLRGVPRREGPGHLVDRRAAPLRT